MRHTKIIATIGPASRSDEIIEQLINAGVDVCRLNFSHGTHDAHAETFHRIRAAATRATKVVSILQDLSGPKIRTGRLKGGKPIDLKDGQTIRIVAGDGEGDEERIYTTYAELVRKTRPGGQLLLDDGKIQLEIERADGREIVAKVIEGGLLDEHKGINAPGVQLSADALTPKDIEDLKFGAQLGVDMVALSFVRSADDMWQARQILTEIGAPNIPAHRENRAARSARSPRGYSEGVSGRHGGAGRPRTRDAARESSDVTEGNYAKGQALRHSGHRRYAGARVDAARAAADAR